MYFVGKDFNFKGGLAGVLKQHWGSVRVVRSDFGTRPNRFEVTEAMDLQVRTAILQGKVQIDILEDLQRMLVWQMGKYFLLRGMDEHANILWSQITLGTYDVVGELFGLPMIELEMTFDKTHALGITNPTARDNKIRYVYVHNQNDSLSLYMLVLKYRCMCPDGQERFYCHAQSDKAIEWNIEHGLDYQSNAKRPLGKNQIIHR